MSVKFELVGEAKTVLLKSWASLLGMASAAFGLIAVLQPQLPLLQPLVSPKVYSALAFICGAAPALATAFAAMVAAARVIKQDKLRVATGAANPQPVAPAAPQ